MTTGIVNERQAPFSAQDFAVENRYQAVEGGRWVVVYAGTIGGVGPNAGEGGVRVRTFDSDGFSGEVDSPDVARACTKSLSIKSISGSVLTLTTETGSTVTFDLLHA